MDTHTFIWWDSNPAMLSPVALAYLCDPVNEVWVSTVCVWEMAIKSQLGKLILHLPLADIVSHQTVNGLKFMDVTTAHVLAVQTLPLAHRDPFDRMLAAQAISEDAYLVTCDNVFSGYPVRICW